MTFYDEWLGLWDAAESERRAARRAIHESELEWVETPQDHRAALMIAPQTGFRTWGSVTMQAEIPPGRSTGRHAHGEEAIFIVQGEGFSVVDGVRYDWQEGSAVVVPFGAPHQHVNTGDVPVRYVSALAVYLEHLVGVHRTVQQAPKGTPPDPDAPRSADGRDPATGVRVVLHRDQAVVHQGGEDARREGGTVGGPPPAFDPEHPLVLGDRDGMDALPAGFHKSEIRNYMKAGSRLNDFDVHSVEISGLLIDPPHESGGLHAHMEAHLYVLQGEGYSVIGTEEVPWRPGTALQVPGPQTPHRHVNTSDVPAHMIRIAFGIRYFVEKFARREFPYLYLAPRSAFAAPGDGVGASAGRQEHAT